MSIDIEQLKLTIEQLKQKEIELRVKKEQLEQEKSTLLAELQDMNVDPKKAYKYLEDLKSQIEQGLSSIKIPEI